SRRLRNTTLSHQPFPRLRPVACLLPGHRSGLPLLFARHLLLIDLPNDLPELFRGLPASVAGFDVLGQQPLLLARGFMSRGHRAEQVEIFVRGFHGQRATFLGSSWSPTSL